MPNLGVFANSIEQFLKAAAEYGSFETEESIARLQTLFAAIELAAPPAITLPTFDRSMWRICRKELGETSLDGGKTWERSPYYSTEQIGSLERLKRWLQDLACIRDAVELHVNQECKSDVTATVAASPTGAPSQMSEIAPVNSTEPFQHTSDFRSIRWGSKFFTFTEKQAACVGMLFEAWQKGTPELNQVTILDAAESSMADSCKPRLRDLFKDHPSWGVFIVKGQRRGTFRLADPEKGEK